MWAAPVNPLSRYVTDEFENLKSPRAKGMPSVSGDLQDIEKWPLWLSETASAWRSSLDLGAIVIMVCYLEVQGS